MSVAKDVECFVASKKYGLAVIHLDGSLKVNGKELCNAYEDKLKLDKPEIMQVASRWIVSEDHDQKILLRVLNCLGKTISRPTLESERIANNSIIPSYRIIKSSNHSAIILAINRNGICYLLSLRSRGRLSVTQATPSILPATITDSQHKTVLSLTATRTPGQYIVGGSIWIKIVHVRLN